MIKTQNKKIASPENESTSPDRSGILSVFGSKNRKIQRRAGISFKN
jgi:hypothetical protein